MRQERRHLRPPTERRRRRLERHREGEVTRGSDAVGPGRGIGPGRAAGLVFGASPRGSGRGREAQREAGPDRQHAGAGVVPAAAPQPITSGRRRQVTASYVVRRVGCAGLEISYGHVEETDAAVFVVGDVKAGNRRCCMVGDRHRDRRHAALQALAVEHPGRLGRARAEEPIGRVHISAAAPSRVVGDRHVPDGEREGIYAGLAGDAQRIAGCRSRRGGKSKTRDAARTGVVAEAATDSGRHYWQPPAGS